MTRRFRYKDIQLPQLRSFCVAATHGNFTAAAKALGLSAPTVWEQVRGLERRLGTTLMIRRGRLVELTSAGRLLLQLVLPHVNGLDSLERLFETQRTTQPQRLTIASTPYMLANHLVEVVRAFTSAHPAVCVNLRPSIRMDDGLRLIERGQADLGVMAYRAEEPHSSALAFEHLFDLRLMLLTAIDHPLARKKRITPQDIVQYPLITQIEGTHSRMALEGMLRRHNLIDQVQFVLESTHFDVVCAYVEAGLGIALLFAGEKGNWTSRPLRARVFDQAMEGLPVGLVTRKGSHLSAPVEAFCQSVRQELCDH